MKRMMILCASLALSACGVGAVSTIPTVIDAISSKGDTVVVRGTQALIVAEYAYNAAGNAILPLLQNGTIRGANATRVRELNRRVTALLIQAKEVQSEGDKAAIAAEILRAVAELNLFKGGG